VLLTGPFAYKFKKPLELPFLDFSTLAQRHRCCVEEVRLNRRTAADLYVGVVRLVATPDGPVIDGDGPVLDYAVKMVQFPESARADVALARGALGAGEIQAFAGLIGDFHEDAGVAKPGAPHGCAACVRDEAISNLRELRQSQAARALRGRRDRQLAELERWTIQTTQTLSEAFARRRATGHVRECHGDLHLANLVLLNATLLPFDCIEFNERLRWIDTMSDLAFVLMDLEAHERPDLGRLLLDCYLARTGDYDGLQVLRHYEVYRALVRAKVAAIETVTSAGNGEARHRMHAQLDLAERIVNAPRNPRLLLLHGASGTGKSWLVRKLIPHGTFVSVRSDVERRRLFAPARSPSEIASRPMPYTDEATAQTYERLSECARSIVQAGHAALVDATFLDRRQRERFRLLARELGVPVRIVDVVAARAIMEARVADRARNRADASEADVEVLREQLATLTPLAPEEEHFTTVVDTTREVDAAALAATLLGA
ncbi:MAG: AAA family ATPase, partial [Gammaproteobacteria bacterium]